MQHRHGFQHSNETDPNEPKHQYWVQKSRLGAFVSFLDESVHRFIFGPDRCFKCNTDMVFSTVTKLTQTNQNINIGSKKVDWARSFRFWMNRCIVSFSARIGALNATPTRFWHSNETDPNEPKQNYWVHKSGFGTFVLFLDELVHRFISSPNRCIKCNTSMVFGTVTKLTQTNQNITIGSKKVDWVLSFCFWMNRCIVSFPARIDALNATPEWFSAQ